MKQAWLIVTESGAIRDRAEILLPDPHPHVPAVGDRAFLVRSGTTPGIAAAGSLVVGSLGWRCHVDLVRPRRPVSPREASADPVLGGRAALALHEPGWSLLTPLVSARLELLLRQSPASIDGRSPIGAEWSGNELEVAEDISIDLDLKVQEVLRHPRLEFGVLLPNLATAEFFVLPDHQSDTILRRLSAMRIRKPDKLAAMSPFRLGLRPGWGPGWVRKAAEVAVATAELGRLG